MFIRFVVVQFCYLSWPFIISFSICCSLYVLRKPLSSQSGFPSARCVYLHLCNQMSQDYPNKWKNTRSTAHAALWIRMLTQCVSCENRAITLQIWAAAQYKDELHEQKLDERRTESARRWWVIERDFKRVVDGFYFNLYIFFFPFSRATVSSAAFSCLIDEPSGIFRRETSHDFQFFFSPFATHCIQFCLT